MNGTGMSRRGFLDMAQEQRARMILGFFSNRLDMLFACACRAWDLGRAPNAEVVATQEWLEHISPAVGEARLDRIACPDALAQGPAFPAATRLPFRGQKEVIPLRGDAH